MAHGKADWIDQDLLTREESRDRLDEQIVFERNKLKDLESVPISQDSQNLTEQRLIAMKNSRDSL
jgi:hypothetical protein